MVYEYEGKTEKEAIEKAVAELGLERDQFDVEILETQKNSLFKKGFVKIRVHVEDSPKNVVDKVSKITSPVAQGEFEEKLTTFIKEIIEKMGYEVKVDVMFREENKIGIKLESASSSILILP